MSDGDFVIPLHTSETNNNAFSENVMSIFIHIIKLILLLLI